MQTDTHQPHSALSELDRVRQAYKLAYERAANRTDADLVTESVLFVKPIHNGEYTVKLTVLFNQQTMPLPANSNKSAKPEVILAPTFTLHDWPKHKMAGEATELDAVTLEDAYDAAMAKLESYSTGGKAKRFIANHQQELPDILTTFGGDDTTGDDDPDAPLPPKTQKTIRHLRMMDHLHNLYTTHGQGQTWFEMDRSDAQRIPHLFGLPRGGVAKGAGPDCTVEAHGYRLERRAYVGKGSRSYKYEYRLTQIANAPAPTADATLVSLTPVPPPQYHSPLLPWDQRATPKGKATGAASIMDDAVVADAPTPPTQQPSVMTLLDTVDAAVKTLRDAFATLEATTADKITKAVKEAVTVTQQAADDYYKQQQAEAEDNYNSLTAKMQSQIDSMNSQMDKLNAKLTKQQKQIRALLDE